MISRVVIPLLLLPLLALVLPLMYVLAWIHEASGDRGVRSAADLQSAREKGLGGRGGAAAGLSNSGKPGAGGFWADP